MGGTLSSPSKSKMSATMKDDGGLEGGSNTTAYSDTTSSGFVLPREEYFFSVVLIPGNNVSDGAGDAVTPPASSAARCAYWRSRSRRSHLRWAMHRSFEHGCQPAMFWRSPFVDEVAESSSKKVAARNNRHSCSSSTSSSSSLTARHHQSNGSSSLEIVRYLSQFAFDFVFDTKNHHAAMSLGQKRRVVVYIVSPGVHVSDQVNIITQMWDEAGIVGGNFEPICVVMKQEHFDERILCRPPRNTFEVDSSIEEEGVGEDETVEETISAEQMATLRGAGLLHGYPTLVFNCNPLSMDCICSDEKGTVLGSAGGSGLSIKLGEILQADGGSDSESDLRTNGRHHKVIPPFDATFEETRDEVNAMLGDNTGTLLENARSFCSYWIYRLNLAVKEDANSAETEEAADATALHRLELISDAIDNDKNSESDEQKGTAPQRTPIFGALYERRNNKRAIVISGADTNLIAHIVDSNKMNPSPAAITFDALTQDISGEDGNMHFPWDDSPPATCWRGEEEEDVSYPTRRMICPIQKNLHLAHYGVAASVMGHYITSRYCDQVIGRRVAKKFVNPAAKQGGRKNEVGEIYRGYIAKAEERDEVKWYYIKYDDGDTEHVARPELIKMIDLYTRVGEDVSDDLPTTKTKVAKGKKRGSANISAAFGEGDGDGAHSDGGGDEPRRQRRRQTRPLCRDGAYHFF